MRLMCTSTALMLALPWQRSRRPNAWACIRRTISCGVIAQSLYDLTVYQVGNSSHHDYLWPYLFRYPGLTVLHDVHVHHARAAALLRTRRADDFRREFAANHPDVSADLAELAVAGFDNQLYYWWPMSRLIIEASRLTAVHSAPLAARLREQFPHARITNISLGHGEWLSAGPDFDRSVACARRIQDRGRRGAVRGLWRAYAG